MSTNHHTSETFDVFPCSVCGSDAIYCCKVCKIVYCSEECQHEDWAQYNHAENCKPIGALLDRVFFPGGTRKQGVFLELLSGTISIKDSRMNMQLKADLPAGQFTDKGVSEDFRATDFNFDLYNEIFTRGGGRAMIEQRFNILVVVPNRQWNTTTKAKRLQDVKTTFTADIIDIARAAKQEFMELSQNKDDEKRAARFVRAHSMKAELTPGKNVSRGELIDALTEKKRKVTNLLTSDVARSRIRVVDRRIGTVEETQGKEVFVPRAELLTSRYFVVDGVLVLIASNPLFVEDPAAPGAGSF